MSTPQKIGMHYDGTSFKADSGWEFEAFEFGGHVAVCQDTQWHSLDVFVRRKTFVPQLKKHFELPEGWPSRQVPAFRCCEIVDALQGCANPAALDALVTANPKIFKWADALNSWNTTARSKTQRCPRMVQEELKPSVTQESRLSSIAKESQRFSRKRRSWSRDVPW